MKAKEIKERAQTCYAYAELAMPSYINETPEYARAMRLAESLRSTLKGSDIDWLSEYRKWLDGEGIESEGEDGWPNEHAYDQTNIGRFIQHQLMV